VNITLQFPNIEKKTSWEAAFTAAKQKLGNHSIVISGVFRNLKRTAGYISGVHFQKCSKFSINIFLYIKCKYKNLHPKGGQAQGPPKYLSDSDYLAQHVTRSTLITISGVCGFEGSGRGEEGGGGSPGEFAI